MPSRTRAAQIYRLSRARKEDEFRLFERQARQETESVRDMPKRRSVLEEGEDDAGGGGLVIRGRESEVDGVLSRMGRIRGEGGRGGVGHSEEEERSRTDGARR
jgi:hypothetical protein